MALYETTRVLLEQVAGEFVTVGVEWGLTVSLEKTKLLAMRKNLAPAAEDNLLLKLEEGEIATVEWFTYFGSTIRLDGEVHSEALAKVAKECRAFGCLQSAIFQNH